MKNFFVVFPDAVLDGELFNWELRQNLKELISLVNKKVHVTPQDLAESKDKVRYYIYDGFGFGATQEDPYQNRKKAIDYAFFSDKFAWRYKDTLKKVYTWVVHSEAELQARYEKFLEDKQEGAIIRLPDVPYENKRSKYLLKYKPVDVAEYRIVAIHEGNGNWAGTAKTVTCQRIDGLRFLDGTDTFDATFKGDMEEARKFLKDHAWAIGRIVTIYFNGYTGYGKPNYAQFDINNYDKGNN